VRAPRTYLIIHHRIADILGKAIRPVHILSAVQEPCDPPPFFQWVEILENLIQSPSNPPTSDRVSTLEGGSYPLRIVLLLSSSTSPSGTGALRDCASPLTRGINDSIIWRHAIVCWDGGQCHGRCGVKEMDCTSQCSRIAERPPTTDLSGGKTSEDSFTRLMANLVVEYAVDFQFDSFSWASLDLVVLSSEDFGLLLCPLSRTGRIRPKTAGWSALHGGLFR
jgi:hypothetical protein